LEFYPIRLEPPTTQLWSSLFNSRTIWNFGILTETGALAELGKLGFSDEALDTLRSQGVWGRTKSGLEVIVPDSVVEAVTPETRVALADWLHDNNYDFYNRIIINIEGGEFSAFTEDKVAPRVLALLKSLSFKRNKVLSFMDLPYVMRMIGDDEEEKVDFIKVILSTKSLMVRLVVDETTDREAVVAYWSQGGRTSRIDSMVRGVESTVGVDKIDIVHLLPPLPRRYLNAFSRVSDTGAINTPDCFWASVHFFQRNPSPRILDALSLEHYLAHDFIEVEVEGEGEGEAELRFGDLVCLMRGDDNSFLHSYVHIADDIVYTKNGASYVHPFILALKSDMMSRYPQDGALKTRVFRRIQGS